MNGGKGAGLRLYEVDVTIRETFTYVVRATNAREARRIVASGGGEGRVVETFACGDRQETGIKTVRSIR